MKINDDLALEAERREELDRMADMVAMAGLQSPGTPPPHIPGDFLVDAMKHIKACDNRARNLGAIFRSLEKMQEGLEGAPKGAYILVEEVLEQLNTKIQAALSQIAEG